MIEEEQKVTEKKQQIYVISEQSLNAKKQKDVVDIKEMHESANFLTAEKYEDLRKTFYELADKKIRSRKQPNR